MPSLQFQRFAISMPAGMAIQVEEACRTEGRNRSEFFREAVRHYLTSKKASTLLQFVIPQGDIDGGELRDDPFQRFTEWNSSADAAYDILK